MTSEQEQFNRNEELVKREVYACVTPMVNFILTSNAITDEGERDEPPFDWDDVENTYENVCSHCCKDEKKCTWDSKDDPHEYETDPKDIYEWWAVSPWLYEELKAQGEPVIDTFPHLWGRTTTGQAIALDGVITRIQRGIK